jgi:glutamine synthetase
MCGNPRRRNARRRDQIDPGIANTSNLYEVSREELLRRGIRFLPTTLRQALDALDKDKVIQEGLGADFASYYVVVRSEEWDDYHQSVSQWEIDRYLMTF